ncbi:membrane protein YqaA with SNARE-associated domain [Rhizobium pisi]
MARTSRCAQARASHGGKVNRSRSFLAIIDFASYFGLFAAALGAATMLPMQSEPVLVGLLLTGKFSVPILLAVASVGNTLGSVVNWFLGRGVERVRDRRWFPVKETALERTSRWYRKYGKRTLLLSWMPVFGDALTRCRRRAEGAAASVHDPRVRRQDRTLRRSGAGHFTVLRLTGSGGETPSGQQSRRERPACAMLQRRDAARPFPV